MTEKDTKTSLALPAAFSSGGSGSGASAAAPAAAGVMSGLSPPTVAATTSPSDLVTSAGAAAAAARARWPQLTTLSLNQLDQRLTDFATDEDYRRSHGDEAATVLAAAKRHAAAGVAVASAPLVVARGLGFVSTPASGLLPSGLLPQDGRTHHCPMCGHVFIGSSGSGGSDLASLRDLTALREDCAHAKQLSVGLLNHMQSMEAKIYLQNLKLDSQNNRIERIEAAMGMLITHAEQTQQRARADEERNLLFEIAGSAMAAAVAHVFADDERKASRVHFTDLADGAKLTAAQEKRWKAVQATMCQAFEFDTDDFGSVRNALISLSNSRAAIAHHRARCDTTTALELEQMVAREPSFRGVHRALTALRPTAVYPLRRATTQTSAQTAAASTTPSAAAASLAAPAPATASTSSK